MRFYFKSTSTREEKKTSEMQTQTQLSRIPIPILSSNLRSRSPSPTTNISTQTFIRNNIMTASQHSCSETKSELNNSGQSFNKSIFFLNNQLNF